MAAFIMSECQPLFFARTVFIVQGSVFNLSTELELRSNPVSGYGTLCMQTCAREGDRSGGTGRWPHGLVGKQVASPLCRRL